MTRIQLRDISNSLAESTHAEDVVTAFLGYLQAVRPDWRASLALYDVHHEAFLSVYGLERRNLVQNAIDLDVDQLPARLVRKFFRPSAFFNRTGQRGLIAGLIQSSPIYAAGPADRDLLAPLTALPHWRTCVCMPLNDQHRVIALLVLTSMHKNGFPAGDIDDLVPVRSMASLALAQHLMPAGAASRRADEEHSLRAADELQARIQHLQAGMAAMEAEKRALESRHSAVTLERDSLAQRMSDDGHDPAALRALGESQRTVQFVREVFEVLSQKHRREDFAASVLTWFCESFGVERCSLMIFDAPSESLRIAAFRGIEPSVARRVRVRLGDGIAGWVAHHRKPLFIRGREADGPVAHTDQDNYTSDSYICVPLIYNGRMFGVLNLSNKSHGDIFDDIDLDRAVLTGSVLGMALGNATSAAVSEDLQAA